MRIQVVYTGGTIGMVQTERGLAPGADVESWLATLSDELRAQKLLSERTLVRFSQLEPLIDSSNATPESWQALIDELCRLRDGADAFVVLHGTDTMAYTSSALSFAFSGCNGHFRAFGKPVVLTGSQLPLEQRGSDARANAAGALQAAERLVLQRAEPGWPVGRAGEPNEAACARDNSAVVCDAHQAAGFAARTQPTASNVWLYFGGKLLSGARAVKTSSWSFQGFDAPNGAGAAADAADNAGGKTLADSSADASGSKTPGASGEPVRNLPKPLPYRRHDVAVLSMAPGISAERMRACLDPVPEAVIVRAYGAGNVPAEEPGLVDALAQAVQTQAPVIVCSQCVQADVRLGLYETGDALSRIGAMGAADTTLEAAYAKTQFLLSQGLGGEGFARAFKERLAGE